MGDMYGCGKTSSVRGCVACLGDEVKSTSSVVTSNEIGKLYELMQRLRTQFDFGIDLRPNPKYLECVLVALKLFGAKDAPTLGAVLHARP